MQSLEIQKGRWALSVLFLLKFWGSCLLMQVEGETVLKFALCYGFRNLQNIVRKIKIGKCDYHFLEVMACPSGCLNGGGQIKPKSGQSGKNLIQSLETVYMENVLIANPFDNPLAKNLYDEWLQQPGSELAKKHLHTEYHPVVKSITSQLQNWWKELLNLPTNLQ